MIQSTVFLSRLLASDSVALGRFVLDLNSPEQDFHDSPGLNLSPQDFLVKNQSSFKDSQYRNSNVALKASLACLLSAGVNHEYNREDRLEASTITTYSLKNSTDKFELVCGNIDTRKWFERRVLGRDRKVYMVVGFVTISGGQLVQDKSYGAGIMADVPIPITGTPLDPNVGFDIGGKLGRQLVLKVADEQICAVQYRRVEFVWFQSKNLDTATLEKKTRWKNYYGQRWADDDADDTDEEDVIESTLGSGVIDDDVDEKMDKTVADDEEQVFFFPVKAD